MTTQQQRLESVMFDDWCCSKQINGNYREALYHQIIMKHEKNVESLTEDDWAFEWSLLLDLILNNLPLLLPTRS